MQRKAKTKRLYLIPVVTKTLDVLELLQTENQPMMLETIHRRAKVSKTTVYRILKTLVHRGYVGQTADRHYEYIARPKKLRFGFAGQSAEMPFSREVTSSLTSAAAAMGVDLLVMDNRYDAAIAIQNAEAFVREHVDIVIEFQVEHLVAPIIADKISAARIPLIAVDIPHPHSTYFGVDNYRVGYEAGTLLADFAVNQWKGRADWVLGLDLEEAGSTVQSRMTGAFEAIRTRLPNLPVECFVRIDGRGMQEHTCTVVREFLQRHPRDTRILIAAANDSSALGAIAALRELRREKHAAVVGQDFVDEMEQEMRRPGTTAVGTVSHEVHLYGPKLIELGLALLRGDKVSPYNFVEHKTISIDQLLHGSSAGGRTLAASASSGAIQQSTLGPGKRLTRKRSAASLPAF